MEAQDPRSGVKYLVGVIRKITRIAQLVPFAYLALYAILLMSESFVPYNVLNWFDTLLYVPPVAVVITLFLSRILKLCAWHKAACLIPSSSQVANFVDSNIVTFTQEEVLVINISIGIITIVFLVMSFRHFFANGK